MAGIQNKVNRSSVIKNKSRKTRKSTVPDVSEVVQEPVVVKSQNVVVESKVPESVVPESGIPETSALPEIKKVLNKDEIRQLLDDNIHALTLLYDEMRKEKATRPLASKLKEIIKREKINKTATLKSVKHKKKPSSNKHSGFSTPVKLSDELVKFTGWSSDVSSRRDVTKYVCEYIRDHSLQKPEDKRIIIADEKLAKLLKYDPENDEVLTYATLQKRIQPHFSRIEVQ
jgi:chromatin remodeling complex protein RSC6